MEQLRAGLFSRRTGTYGACSCEILKTDERTAAFQRLHSTVIYILRSIIIFQLASRGADRPV
jgi:hypothetical protein